MLKSQNIYIYRASAGSGKTYTLALKYIRQLLMGDPKTAHRGILAATFTNDAAGEMKERILDYLHKTSEGNAGAFLENLKQELPETLRNDEKEIQRRAGIAFHAILHDYSNFHVTTIDSFFQTIVRNLARELGIGSRFDIELNTELPVKEAVSAVISEASDKSVILARLMKFVEHKLEDDKWSIERDLQSFSRFIFDETFQRNESAINSAFGKDPDKTANAVTLCKQFIAVYDLKMSAFADRFFAKGIPEEDFYYTSKGLPSYFEKIKKRDYADPNRYVDKVLCRDAGKTGDDQCYDLLIETENFRTGNRNLDKYNTAKLFLKYIYQLELLKDIAEKINEQNAEQNRFILAHTNQLLSGLIGDRDTSFIFEKTGAQIQSVVIDEFQDTSELQWKNFKALISEMLSTGSFGMLVGDVKQSIYRWRNGNWKILNDIENEFGDQAVYRSLQTNYRSSKNVIEFNNKLFSETAKALQGNESDDRKPFAKAYKDVEQQQHKESEGYVSVDFVPAIKEEYDRVVMETIADKVFMLLEAGVCQGDICILCRNNKHIRLIANELPLIFAEKYPDSGEKIRIISENAYQLGSSAAVNMIISALRIIDEPENPVPAASLFLKTSGNDVASLSKTAVQALIEDVLKLKMLSLYDLVIELCGKFFDGNAGADVFAFIDKLTDYLSRNTPDIGKFLDYWDEKLSSETLPLPVKGVRDGILAMSIHKSKGLQFHTVIMPFTDWSMAEKSSPFKENVVWCESADKQPPFNFPLLPVEYGALMENSFFGAEYVEETYNQQMDNLNVLYVALTRAEKNLLVITKKPSPTGTTLTIQDFIMEYTKSEHYEKGTVEKHDEQREEQQNAITVTFNPGKEVKNG
ncbi:MAG: UvrD-helicase domain-containing protein [Tannerella sp.]|jgi:ATP-dependent exoDNAse (exonuclease V) beta subunit|nr:UvrD-helicase domain-containing protein [Tannerella sp.]